MRARSRHWMVRQSVLNAAAKQYPNTLSIKGEVASVRRMMKDQRFQGREHGCIIHEWVLDEWRELVKKYGEPA